MNGEHLVFDLETNGLLNDATRIHCLSIFNLESGEVESYNDEKYGDGTFDIKEDAPMANRWIHTGLQRLEDADLVIGHNIIGFDVPIIHKFYSWFTGCTNVVDTLLLSRLFHPNILKIDQTHQWKHMPLQLYGRHSLDSYGYRLGEYKGEFGKTSNWKEWSPEMQIYCEQDTKVTAHLWKHFLPYLTGAR